MAREVFFKRTLQLEDNNLNVLNIEAVVNFDESQFGRTLIGVTPWTISINDGAKDLGRIVGFEGDGQVVIGMHKLKPDAAAKRGCEITVFRLGNELVMNQLDAPILSAFERWMLRRGWKGDVLKKLKFSDERLVVPVRTFWVRNGYELILAEENKWDEHVVKRWR
jgi:hypothetical protein